MGVLAKYLRDCFSLAEVVTVTLHCVTLNSGEKRPGVLVYRIINMRGEEMFAG